MRNILVGILILSAILPICIGDNGIHDDIIIGIYNETCIETSNYQYMFIHFSDISPNIGEEIYTTIIFEQDNYCLSDISS
jgi:hypothetical protein